MRRLSREDRLQCVYFQPKHTSSLYLALSWAHTSCSAVSLMIGAAFRMTDGDGKSSLSAVTLCGTKKEQKNGEYQGIILNFCISVNRHTCTVSTPYTHFEESFCNIRSVHNLSKTSPTSSLHNPISWKNITILWSGDFVWIYCTKSLHLNIVHRHWGVNRSYKNVWMRLYECIWISHHWLKRKTVMHCQEIILI